MDSSNNDAEDWRKKKAGANFFQKINIGRHPDFLA
jgi:hypothetical protein